MPSKASKKSKGAKKAAGKQQTVQAPAKYTISPPMPCVTRAASAAAGAGLTDQAIPSLIDVPDQVLQAPVVSHQSLIDMENRFDAKFSQMETTIRSALVASASRPTVIQPTITPQVVAAPTPTVTASLPEATPPIAGTHASRSPSRKHHRNGRGHGHSSPARSSSSRGSSSSSSSSSRSRSRSSDHKRRHRKRHGKYSSLRYLPEFKSVSTYERLVLANLRMLRRFFKKERDISGMLDHFILLAEKAEKDVFIDEALLAYDNSVKERAKEHGLKEFDTLKPSEIVKHLSYDGTKAGSTKVSRKAVRQQASGGQGGGTTSGACLKFNFATGGCRRSQCNYKHVCSACSSPGHVNADCPNVDRSGRPSKK